ncbi:glycosyltransferase family 2 protein [Variovorax dokdonensis]|uniref:Glycosyltransferase family 2 protein n=1 Tax=Variovorax dokdonensis TaxID=344883 RepID=A0ABT7N9J8_9BURK|nr:glycosyltransferase family 2 protein [Variovorax dokdonensis]
MKFSIVTASYNAANELLRTARSIAKQSYRDFEWIVVDGASSDGTKKLFKEYHPEFAAAFTSEPDAGIYNALNKGIARISGDWVLFLGAGDELFASDTLQILSEYLPHVDASKTLVYGDVHEVGNQDNLVLKVRNERWEGLDGPWVIGRPVLPCHQGVLHRAQIFTDGFRFDEKLKIAADNELLLRELIAGRGCKIDQVVAKFLRGGISSGNTNRARMIFECIAVNWKIGIFWRRPIYQVILLLAAAVKPYLQR